MSVFRPSARPLTGVVEKKILRLIQHAPEDVLLDDLAVMAAVSVKATWLAVAGLDARGLVSARPVVRVYAGKFVTGVGVKITHRGRLAVGRGRR